MLNDEHGCRGLHQRRLSLAGGAALTGTAEGRGEAWYVIRGSGELDAGAAGTGPDAGAAGTGPDAGGAGTGPDAGGAGTGPDAGRAAGLGDTAGTVELRAGTAVWLRSGLGYRAGATGDLEMLAITVRAEAGEGPRLQVVRLEACQVERTGDREFRVLLSEGLSFTQFAGLIPPGRAPEHHHTYDEVVHVLAGQGLVHLGGAQREIQAEIGPGTSIYLPPYQPHCLENTGAEPLQVLGVFYPAGSPAAKQTS
jgi:mannose-6-phosphate isomerase-like protein (cupin superfamily)